MQLKKKHLFHTCRKYNTLFSMCFSWKGGGCNCKKKKKKEALNVYFPDMALFRTISYVKNHFLSCLFFHLAYTDSWKGALSRIVHNQKQLYK